jgi:hypothetical protein
MAKLIGADMASSPTVIFSSNDLINLRGHGRWYFTVGLSNLKFAVADLNNIFS